VHLDLFVDSAAEQRSEVDRLVALGPAAWNGTFTHLIPISWYSPIPTAISFAWSTSAVRPPAASTRAETAIVIINGAAAR